MLCVIEISGREIAFHFLMIIVFFVFLLGSSTTMYNCIKDETSYHDEISWRQSIQFGLIVSSIIISIVYLFHYGILVLVK